MASEGLILESGSSVRANQLVLDELCQDSGFPSLVNFPKVKILISNVSVCKLTFQKTYFPRIMKLFKTTN